MFDVKTVARGNSLALSLPKDKRFKKDQRWILIPSTDGESFTLIPRIEDPYAGTSPDEPMTEEWPDVSFGEVE
ncbi:type II toxin-antitoxin system PemI/MazE family antitoxin [Loigolactobacillus binensis]|uniref:Type II toxin-antitoxin system PemI/MazE family antitoxin n=1 Tax=Loigolactobacillus binensis TaxID=2559922 RepID=A0ABW3E967_9LACO|nr:transcription elongation factor GreAB [Loigolactobacillus binensis]